MCYCKFNLLICMNHATNQTTESNNPIQKLDIVWGTVCPCQCPWNQQTWRSQCSKWKVIHSRCSYMMSQKRRRLPPEMPGLNTPCSSIAGLQWGLSADTEHMEWIMGLITSIQELPGVRQKNHNAHFMAWIAWPDLLPKLQDMERSRWLVKELTGLHLSQQMLLHII